MGNWQGTVNDGRALQITAGPYLQLPFLLRLQGRQSTYRTAVIIEDGRRARPPLPTLPGTGGTITRQGPSVRLEQLGALHREDY